MSSLVMCCPVASLGGVRVVSRQADSSRLMMMRKGFAGSLRTMSCCARNQRLQTASSQSPKSNNEGSTDDSGDSDASDRSTIGSLDAILGIEGDIEDNNNVAQEQEQEQVSWVEAPLKRASAGPMLPGGNSYLLLGLRFPYAATVRQRKEGQRGVSLDFVVDTGSTCNVLMPAVASELALPLDSEATPAGWGAQGAIASAPQFVLGDCQLDHLEDKERFTLMTGLKASGLMVPSPGAAGILGRAFLDCFPAVEFQLQERNIIRFHAEWDADSSEGMTPVDLELLGETGLWGVRLQLGSCGGVPALLDTGSPVTVLNSACAEKAGLRLPAAADGTDEKEEEESQQPPKSLLGRLFGNKQRDPPPPPPPMVPGDRELSVRMETSQQQQPQEEQEQEEGGLIGASSLELGAVRPMIGDLPGFAALGLAEGDPGAILGLDALSGCKRLVLVASQRRLYVSL